MLNISSAVFRCERLRLISVFTGFIKSAYHAAVSSIKHKPCLKEKALK